MPDNSILVTDQIVEVSTVVSEVNVTASEQIVSVTSTVQTVEVAITDSPVTVSVAPTQVAVDVTDSVVEVTIGSSGLQGAGVPDGGTAGQILAKVDAVDFNTEWIDNYTSEVKHLVKAGTAINKGQAVYVSGATGTNMIVSKASNDTEATSSKTMGLLETTLATNGQGYVIVEGLLAGLDTSAATAGDPVWLGTNGNLIYGLTNKPVAPAHLVFIGIVTRAHQNQGEIFIKPQNGFEVQELHNALITSPIDGDVFTYDGTTNLWRNEQPIVTTVNVSSPITNSGTFTAAQLGFNQTAEDAYNDLRYVKQANQQIFVSNASPVAPPSQYLWVQTGLGTTGNDFTFWIGT